MKSYINLIFKVNFNDHVKATKACLRYLIWRFFDDCR